MKVEPFEPTIPDILDLNAKWRTHENALIYGDIILSWADLNRKLNQTAHGLQAMGLQKGDRVAVFMQNDLSTVIAMLGAVKSGAVLVPLNLSVTNRTAALQINDSDCSAVFATPDESRRIDEIRSELSTVPASNFIIAGEEKTGWTRLETWLDKQSTDSPTVSSNISDTMYFIYSSGTTGIPKGIVHTHKNGVGLANTMSHNTSIQGGSVIVHAIGLYSNLSWITLLCAVYCSACFVLMKDFDPETMLSLIERHQGTHLNMVPVMYQLLMNHPSFPKSDISSLKTVLSAGSPLSFDLKKQMMDELQCDLVELYGLTEGFFTFLTPKDALKKPKSVGRPTFGGDMRIVDDDDRDVSTGDQGEIIGRTAYVMRGYLNQPQKTKDAFLIDENGNQWLRTGDIGKIDEEGFLYITDRKKDMIISGGQNIFPTDIESIAIGHPQVKEVAVIGIPHEKWGETPMALVVLKQSASIAKPELIEWINSRVGKRQRINALEFRESLPRNPMGKLLKKELRQPYWPESGK